MIQKRDLGAIYTPEWFEHDFRDLGPEFALVARGIDRWARGGKGRQKEVLDVGCGPALLIDHLAQLGWDATGFDGSPHAEKMAEKLRAARTQAESAIGRMFVADVLDAPDAWQFEAPDRFDPPGHVVTRCHRSIVICTEVAEHLPADQAPTLVRYLTSHALDYVIFTAAPPGQGGHDHVNEQPPEYWRDLFAAEGWIPDNRSTDELRQRWRSLERLSHMTRNVQVYR